MLDEAESVTEPTAAAAEIQKSLLILILATVALYLIVVAGVVFVAWQAYDSRSQVNRTNAALCVFRVDLEARVSSESVTLQHPSEFGISAAALAALRITVAGQKRTVESLGGLKCGG